MKPIIALTHEEVVALLTKAREHDHRAYLMFLVCVLHGLRVSELLDLRVKNFTVSDGEIYLSVQRLKGSLKTTQKLLLAAPAKSLFDEAGLMRDWLQNMKPTEYVFTNSQAKRMTRWGVSYLWEQYCRWAGIPSHKRHIHCAKHTAGVLLRKSGASLEIIQARLGHKRLDSTAAYLRVTTDDVDSATQRAFGGKL